MSCKAVWAEFWHYETQKIMVVKKRNIAITYRIIQFTIMTYFLVATEEKEIIDTRQWGDLLEHALREGYVFIIQKSYQDKENAPQSSVITKVKGIAVTNSSFENNVWDVAEYINPPEGGDIFSITVQTKTTPYQRLSTCPEHSDVPGSNCTTNSDCVSGEMGPLGNGVKTGRCVTFRESIKTCEVYAWCPVENTASTRGNIQTNGDPHYLKKCMFDEEAHLYCPIFPLKFIIEKSGVTLNRICKTGGVLGVIINWECDLDKAASKCKPKYSFRSLDRGYNFRKARYFMENGTKYRTLTKVFGIRIDVIVHGEAGKFSIIPLVINVASALTSIGIGSFLCDWILLTFMNKNDVYKEKKFEEVFNEENKLAHDDDAEKKSMTGPSHNCTDC